jgi:hypothetical protein
MQQQQRLSFETICKIVGQLYLQSWGQIENQNRIISELREKLKEKQDEALSGEPDPR